MRRKTHDASKEPAGLPSNETTREQGKLPHLPLPSNNGRSTAHEQQNSSLHPPVTQDDSNHCSNDVKHPRESTASQTIMSDSRTAYATYTRSSLESKSYPHPTEQDTTTLISVPLCIKSDEICGLLKNAAVGPPVTPETLKELDLQWIQNNISLRVDVHYDYDLHFMPISGRRGEEKWLDAQNYWRALEWEFRIYQHNASGPCPNCPRLSAGPTPFHFNQRLPIMFHKLKALLLILVPNHDHSRVSDTLDVALLMQQVQNGVLDVLRLSGWLSDLLTTHCAPIRDEWAHDMREKISEGARQGDMATLVAGLEKLFSFCEAMKLDVANHQIRTFRLPLIEDGVSFQRDYFQIRMRLGKLDPRPSILWFASMHEHCLQKDLLDFEHSPLVHGLIFLVTHPGEDIPELFRYDHNRIQQLREEISDLVHLNICWDFLIQQINQQFDSSLCRVLKTRLLDLTDGESNHEAGLNAVWDAHVDAISIEVARLAFTILRPSTEMIPSMAIAKIQENLEERFQTEPETRLVCLAAQLQKMVLHHVGTFDKLSALQISELQQQHQQWHQTGIQGRPIPDLEDISRRLAHTAVIHWRVWRDLYLPAINAWRKESWDDWNGLSDTPCDTRYM